MKSFSYLITAAPCAFFRTPLWSCPHIFAGGVLGSALVSNTGLLATAGYLAAPAAPLPLDGPLAATVGVGTWFAALGACTGASALGFFVLWLNMVPAFRPTFYRRRTMGQYVHGEWNDPERTFRTWGASRNDARALLLTRRSTCYWPSEAIVGAWLRENWAEWTALNNFGLPAATRPKWFDEKWRAMFPREWLPGTFSIGNYQAMMKIDDNHDDEDLTIQGGFHPLDDK
jgi:hypothetical protein